MTKGSGFLLITLTRLGKLAMLFYCADLTYSTFPNHGSSYRFQLPVHHRLGYHRQKGQTIG